MSEAQGKRRGRGLEIFCIGVIGACAAGVAGAAASPSPAAGAVENLVDNVTGTALNLVVKDLDVVGLEMLEHPPSDYMKAASQVFQQVLHPYYIAINQRARDAVLQRIAFNCAEDQQDPVTPGHSLAFPVQLLPASRDALVWHRYACTFRIDYKGLLGQALHYTSPVYTINQLDIRYGAVDLQPAVAMQNYNLGSAAQPDYAWLGRYVQPLDRLLRDHTGAVPAQAIAGVNGGYDYRVDAWASGTPHDNICLPRYALGQDRQRFFAQHPPAAQCAMDGNALPLCASGDTLPITDDLGDSLVYLAPAQRAKSWRGTPFQSYNCGSLGESVQRGALLLYSDDADARRTSPSKDNVAELDLDGKPAVSAIGSGPLLIDTSGFVYDEAQSEEGRPIDNYEVGGQTGVGVERGANGAVTLHLINVDGHDYTEGMHDWLMGLYFLSAYAHSDAAVALGNGGDATLWINPAAAAVQAVLRDTRNANHAYFEALFAQNSHPGIVSNCSGFTAPPIGCSARPIHDGLFLYTRP
ncbi:MAG: hypothetical protein JWR07_3916 [Nevskia sp.]|nr:hypothetical protein [Nevskia sp.]